ncbi:hypothetical protein BOX15_Mlig019924g1 [Macrostomum lignano]|uniref:Calpain-3 n=2 Tax=Macrostomum lignano TaxID=282301 RepID=A0A267EIH1_9PLAT|nr:hypothetical protein BOX15_Mlig019924g1 [Macrostomum lignano]
MPHFNRNPPASAAASRGPATSRAASKKSAEISSGDEKFRALKKELSSKKQLYEDPDFPAQPKSIFYSRQPPRPFEWKRPHELCDNPRFFVGGASRFDVRQGELGDCWLLAAVASLSMHPQLFDLVVPQDQDFTDADYCGVVRFRFWQFGEWTDVLVDDRLPTYNNRLVFMHSTDSNEFWSALLEKAYAKMMGSYEALKGGSASEAMEDFTGGITEFYDLRQNTPPSLFQTMVKANKRSSLMGCSIEADPNQIEAQLSNGLIMGHAYSITDVQTVEVNLRGKKGAVQLLRIRNPWGNEAEWKGAWGDSSPEWSILSEDEKKKMGLSFDDDGEFWMSFQDFCSNFQKLEICHLGPDSLNEEQLGAPDKNKRRWEALTHNSAWRKRVSAGGCRNYLDTFWTNPQFRVKVIDPDEDDDENKGSIIVGLMQKNMRKKRSEGLDLHTIGYAIYRIKDGDDRPLDLKFFKCTASVAKAPAFINLREVCGRHKLDPGTYVIVPSTFEPNQEAEFLLRIYSETKNESGEMDDVTTVEEVQPDREPTAQEKAQEKALKEAFQKIAGEDMEVDAYELRDIVNTAFQKEFKFDGFSVETCRSMVALMDVDQSGKLGFDEFKTLWNDLRLWKTVFKKYDSDKSGNFNSYELRQALNAVGFRVNNKIFSCLVMRYATREGIIEFDDYVLCCVRLKTVFETFKAQPKDGQGKATFSQEEFLQTIIYV